MIALLLAAALASGVAAADFGDVSFSDLETPPAPAAGAPVDVQRIRAIGDPLDACQSPDSRHRPGRRAAATQGPSRNAAAPEPSRSAAAPFVFTDEHEENLFVETAHRRHARGGAIPSRPRHSQTHHSNSPGRGPSLRPISPAELPEFEDDLASESAVEAARRTAAYWSARPAGQKISLGSRSYTAGQLAKSLTALAELFARKLPPAALRSELAERFDLFQSVGRGEQGTGTVTGYFAPDIPIRETPGDWRVPILRSPGGTVSLSAREIADGALGGRGLELFWTQHPADLLALQIEGAGWGVLPDGQKRLLNSTDSNTYSFRSVAHALQDCGITPDLLGPIELAAYLKAQPFEREQKMVELDPRYVFFRTDEGGPRGESEIELVAGRSIAIDPSQVPMAQAGLLFSRRPVASPQGGIAGERDFARFVFTHDTGDAIKGPARVDLFWGDGPGAELEASHMMEPGRLFLFVLKTDPGDKP